MSKGTRARDARAKEEKRNLILQTAWAFLEEKELTDISMAQVAKGAGVAKGTLYLYFKTREEIFISLLGQEIAAWQASLRYRLSQGADVSTLIETIVRYAADRPRFMRLAVSSSLVLEQNISEECALAYKRAIYQDTQIGGAAIETAFPDLPKGAGATLLLQTYALTLGTWQTANPPETMRAVIEKEGLELFLPDFEDMLRNGLTALWTGFQSLLQK